MPNNKTSEASNKIHQEIAQAEETFLQQIEDLYNTNPFHADIIPAVTDSFRHSTNPRTANVSDITALQTNPFQYLQRNQHNDVEQDEEFWLLVNSIRTYGYLGGIIVTETESNSFCIVSGHRRRDAIAYLHRTENFPISGKVTVVNLTEEAMVRLLVNSNTTQKSLSPLKIIETIRYFNEPNPKNPNKKIYSIRELPPIIGLSTASIVRYLKLSKMPAEIQQAVEKGTLPITRALEMYREINSPTAEQSDKPPSTTPNSTILNGLNPVSVNTAALNTVANHNPIYNEEDSKPKLNLVSKPIHNTNKNGVDLLNNIAVTKRMKLIEQYLLKAQAELGDLESGSSINREWAIRLHGLLAQLDQNISSLTIEES